MPSSASTHPDQQSLPTRRSSDLPNLLQRGKPSNARSVTASWITRAWKTKKTWRTSSPQSAMRAARSFCREGCSQHGQIFAKCSETDRKSTRLNSSHTVISYAVFCFHSPRSTISPYTTLFRSAKPFTTRKTFKRQIGDRILDHSCLENEKDLENLVPTIGDAGR